MYIYIYTDWNPPAFLNHFRDEFWDSTFHKLQRSTTVQTILSLLSFLPGYTPSPPTNLSNPQFKFN